MISSSLMTALQIAAIAIAAISAITDWRLGRIPNWLTFPTIIVPPIVLLVVDGRDAAIASLAGILFCVVAPYLLFRSRAMGAGDVKLFAGLGALLGAFLGIEAEFFSILIAALFALIGLAARGVLMRTLSNTFYLALNPILPKAKRRKIERALLDRVRLGPAVLIGTFIAIMLRNPYFLAQIGGAT